MTCKDCIHENICVIIAFPEAFENTKWEKEPCDHFKNKADYAEVKHGEWIKDDKIKSPIYFNCSLCGNTADKDIHGNYIGIPPYCSMCGAKMDGGNLSAIPTGLEGRADNEQSIKLLYTKTPTELVLCRGGERKWLKRKIHRLL